jgi:hypothetical protein
MLSHFQPLARREFVIPLRLGVVLSVSFLQGWGSDPNMVSLLFTLTHGVKRKDYSA